MSAQPLDPDIKVTRLGAMVHINEGPHVLAFNVTEALAYADDLDAMAMEQMAEAAAIREVAS